MKKSTMAILIAVIAVLAISGVIFAVSGSEDDGNNTGQTAPNSSDTTDSTNPTGTDTADSTGDQSDATEVEIEDFAFGPPNITVKKGTTVTWTNKDSSDHTVTPDEETAGFEGSGMLGKNETYSVTFDTVGEFSYHCQPHPQMQGTVTVTE